MLIKKEQKIIEKLEKKKIGGKMLFFLFTKWEEMSRVGSRDRHA